MLPCRSVDYRKGYKEKQGRIFWWRGGRPPLVNKSWQRNNVSIVCLFIVYLTIYTLMGLIVECLPPFFCYFEYRYTVLIVILTCFVFCMNHTCADPSRNITSNNSHLKKSMVPLLLVDSCKTVIKGYLLVLSSVYIVGY